MINSFDLTGKPGLEEFIRRQIATAVEAERVKSEKRIAELEEAAFRAEHRELVSAACWHRAAELANKGNWQSLRLRLSEMTAEERHARVVLSMDSRRAARSAIKAEGGDE